MTVVSRAGNIFDENDWISPTTKPDKPEIVIPPPPVIADKPAETANPQANPIQPDPPKAIKLPPPKVATTTTKLPIPAKAAQNKSRKLFKEIYAADLVDRTPNARRQLAEKLFKEAGKVKDVPADRYVLLVGVTEAARDGADLRMLIHAANVLENEFDFDTLHMKTETALKMSLRSDSAAINASNTRAALELADALIAAEEYRKAQALLQVIKPLATEPAVDMELQEKLKTSEMLRVAGEKVAGSIEKLKTAPDDPAANLAVGRYLCYFKNDWTLGIPYLAKSTDQPTKSAVNLETGNPTDADGKVEVANAWWAIAEKETGLAQLTIRQHAVDWYMLGLDSGKIVGLERMTIEKKIATVPVRIDPSSPMAQTHPNRRTLIFENHAGTVQLFQTISKNKIKAVGPAESVATMQTKNVYEGVGIVVWDFNRWRDLPATAFTDDVRQSMQQFVNDGGDLIMFEQFNCKNLGVMHEMFGFQSDGCGPGVAAQYGPMKSQLIQAGFAAETLRGLRFYNSYHKLPENSVVLLKNGEGKNVAVVIPYGKGRVIMIGAKTDGGDRKIVDLVLELIYHYNKN